MLVNIHLFVLLLLLDKNFEIMKTLSRTHRVLKVVNMGCEREQMLNIHRHITGHLVSK